MTQSHVVDINKITEVLYASQLEGEEQELFLCELLLKEFKQMNATDIRKHFKYLHFNKQDREGVLRLAFPLDINPYVVLTDSVQL